MSSDLLEKLFGSSIRVKIMRLFLLHPDEVFANADIARRTKSRAGAVRREILMLKKIGFIKQATQEVEISFSRRKRVRKKPQKGKKIKGSKYTYQSVTEVKKKKNKGWRQNDLFPLYHSLKGLVLNAVPTSKEKLISRLRKLGSIKLVILSGIFIQENDSRLDILIVGDSVRRGALEKVLRSVEAEIGKELDYALLNTKEFLYRLGMYDKFIRDILDYPHEKLINKLNI